MNFLRKATGLDTYGVDPHPVKVNIQSDFFYVTIIDHSKLILVGVVALEIMII